MTELAPKLAVPLSSRYKVALLHVSTGPSVSSIITFWVWVEVFEKMIRFVSACHSEE